MSNTTANFNLGVMYEHGRGVSIDVDKAVTNYTIAAKAGDTAADLSLAKLLLAKEGSDPKSQAKWVKQAVYHLQSATESATPATAAAANGELGRLYWSGTGVKKDRARAESLLHDAAAAGDQRAIDFLAGMQ
jgi:hypothetical protein